ncbi:hypothetical protein ABTE72_19495, partial [Acinetobacter baumannii]
AFFAPARRSFTSDGVRYSRDRLAEFSTRGGGKFVRFFDFVLDGLAITAVNDVWDFFAGIGWR